MKIRYSILSVVVLVSAVAVQAADQNAALTVNTAELIAVLRSDAPKAEKAKTLKPLAVFAGKEAVPVIAPYLSDEELSSWARIALEAIPDPACDEVLRKAATNLKGRLLIGVINSIGVRGDGKAVDALVARLGDPDEAVATAAAAALGRIPNEAAAKALERALATAVPAVRSEVADAVVRCAERSLADGKNDEAIRLYDLVAKADVPQNRALEGVRGAIVARGKAGLPLLVELLKSTDKKRFGLALKLTREISAPALTDALLAELRQAGPARQPLLLMALADRADPKAREALLQAAQSGVGEARIASIRGLKNMGDSSCGPVLLKAALDEDDNVSEAAIEILADLPAKEIDDLVVARLPAASGKSRLVLIGLVGRRHIETVTKVLMKAADDPDAQVRAAALTALGETISVRELSFLTDRAVAQGQPEDAQAADAALRAACARMSDREASTAKVLEAMAAAPVPGKCRLVGVLVTIGGGPALKAVAAAARDANAEVRRAGYRALGEWTSADAGPVLLELVQNGEPDLKTNALRAYIRIARQFDIPNGPRMAMFQEIMTLAQRDDERRLALDILKQIRTPQSLATAVKYLEQPKLCDAAAGVAVTMSEKMIASKPSEVAAAMQQVIERAKNKETVEKARSLLNRMGKK